MKRSTRFFVAVAVLAVLGAVAGSLVAMSVGEQVTGVTRPAGDDNVLRIEAVQGEVGCGSGTVAVNLYLDDLVTRPSPLDETAPRGMAGFQAIVRYDPEVLRLGPGPDLQLGPQLDTFDADGDGVTRRFFVVHDVDDYIGRAVIGAASVVTESAGSSREEGPQPVSQGRPVLLMTINFRTIGRGETALRLPEQEPELRGSLARPGIIDPAGELYEPLTLEDGSLTVAGGDCPVAPEITPRPTPGPTATTPVEPTIEIPTPLVLTPTSAATGGRPDCPESWHVYAEPETRFSLCYPTEWTAVAAPPEADLGWVITVTGKEGAFVTAYWKETSYFDSPDFSDPCGIVPDWLNAEPTPVEIAGLTGRGCLGDASQRPHEPPGPVAQLDGTFAEIPLGAGEGYLIVFVIEPRGPEGATQREEAAAVISTLLVGEQ